MRLAMFMPLNPAGIAETMHAEIAPLGLRSLVIEPGYFRTDFLTADNRAPYVSRISDYQPMTDRSNAGLLGA